MEVSAPAGGGAASGCLPFNRNVKPLTARVVAALVSRYNKSASPFHVDAVSLARYNRAMVHRSYCESGSPRRSALNARCPAGVSPLQPHSYERLEYLGDSIIGAAIAAYLYERYPDENEGFLTMMRSHLVNGTMLSMLCRVGTSLVAHIAVSAQVEDGAHGGRIVPIDGDSRPSRCRTRSRDAPAPLPMGILEDVLEAFVGALFLHVGFDAAASWFVGLVETHVDFSELCGRLDTPKAMLNGFCSSKLGFIPAVDRVARAADAAADRGATVRLTTPDGAVVIASATAACYGEAENVATRKAIEYYGIPVKKKYYQTSI